MAGKQLGKNALTLFVTAAIFALGTAAGAQAPGAAAREPELAAASVRYLCAGLHTLGNCDRNLITYPVTDPARFVCPFCTPTHLLFLAFNLLQPQIKGDDALLNGDYFRVEFTTSAPASPPQMRQFMQTVMVKAFGLACHMEEKPSPVYRLVLGKNGMKMGSDSPGTGDARADMIAGFQEFDSMEALVKFLNTAYYFGTSGVDHPVEDGTGLKGPIHLRLDYGAGISTSEIALLPLIKKQLGLATVLTQGHTEYLVVDKLTLPRDHWTGP